MRSANQWWWSLVTRLLLTSALIALQAIPARGQQDRLTITVVGLGHGLAYAKADHDANAMDVFVDDPIRFAVHVYNNSGREVTVASNTPRWSDAFSFSFENVSEGVQGRPAVPFLSAVVEPTGTLQRPGEPLTIGPRKMVIAAFRLRSVGRSDIPVGRYQMFVQLNPGSLDEVVRRQVDNDLRRRVVIAVREARTPEELADSYLHAGARALEERRFDEAQQWHDKVLAWNPASIPALMAIARGWEQQADCARAATFYERAAVTALTFRDPGLRNAESQHKAKDIAANARAAAAKCR